MSEEPASSVLSSVLGFVSREIQDFVVSAVTGTATGPSQPLGSSSSKTLKHKRSRSVVRSTSTNSQSVGKRSRRPSVSHRENDTDDIPSGSSPWGSNETQHQATSESRTGPSAAISSPGEMPSRSRDPSEKSTKGLMGPPPTPSPNSTRTRSTMPGSLFPRSPTPAEFRDKPLPPPTTSRKAVESSSPESSTQANRGRRRSLSRVRFDPVVVRRIDPRSPSPPTEQPITGAVQSIPSIPPAEPAIKIEDDDEIQILDRMPSPPRGRATAPEPTSNAPEASSSQRPASPRSEPVPIPNQADMSISEFTWQDKGKAKETFPEDDTDEPESSTVKQLMEEIRRLKSELANQSSTNSSISMAPPAPPAPPPPPPPGYIAIPATSWKNGIKHPSQRPEMPKPKPKRKSLQSTVPLESMEAFLSELKTVKLRSTGAGTYVSPMTLRRQQNGSISSVNSEVSTGLLTLRAQLKRKDVPDGDHGETEVPRKAPRRQLSDSPPRVSPPHHEIDSHLADNSGSTLHSSANEEREGSQSMSWSFPGPSRSTNYGRFPNRPPEARPKPSNSLAASRAMFNSRLDPLRHEVGLAASDMTTPSLCSDTDDHPQESFKSTQPEEDLLTPCEDEMAGLQPAIAPSAAADFASRRTSDLHLDELIERRYPSPPKKQADPQRQPPRSIKLAKRISYPPPVEGSPNVFSTADISISRTPKSPPRQTINPSTVFTSRPPKSPLPLEPRPQKPKPPRASSGQSPLKTSTTTSYPPKLGQSRPSGSSMPSTITPTPIQDDGEDELKHAPSPDLHPIQLPLPDPQFATFRKSTGLRTAKSHLEASLCSLDDELRAVSANERIAELNLDLELAEMDMTMGVEDEEDVFSGTGTRPRGSGFTSGGGGGGIAVTYGLGGGQPPSRSRIPVLGRSR